jgi:hypothetical protein
MAKWAHWAVPFPSKTVVPRSGGFLVHLIAAGSGATPFWVLLAVLHSEIQPPNSMLTDAMIGVQLCLENAGRMAVFLAAPRKRTTTSWISITVKHCARSMLVIESSAHTLHTELMTASAG